MADEPRRNFFDGRWLSGADRGNCKCEWPGTDKLSGSLELGSAGSTQIVVTNNGKVSQPIEVELLDAPGLFSQDGVHAVALRVTDYSLVTDANPAVRGEAIVLCATGLGPVSPAWPTDTPASAAILSTTVAPTELTLHSLEGGQGMTILFSGLAPGFIGLYQINAVVPTGVPPGDLNLTLSNGWQGNTLKLPTR
jgi:uncharacterized protein (TIGR03437 family)